MSKLSLTLILKNRFDLLVVFVFAVSPQLGEIGPKVQDLVISFWLGEVESLPEFHPTASEARSEIYMFNNEWGQKKTSLVNTP